MSFKIETAAGLPRMTFDQDNTILPDLILSHSVKRGSWFMYPGFGSDAHSIRKMTADAPALVRNRTADAMKWLLDAGRAKSIAVYTEAGQNRIDISVNAIQADGMRILWNTWVEVV